MKRTSAVLSIVWAFAFLTFFVARPEGAQPVNPGSSGYTSARGIISMDLPRPVVLGERFEVRLMLSEVKQDEAHWPLHLRWWPAREPDQSWGEKEDFPGMGDAIGGLQTDIAQMGAAPPKVSVIAPFERPGLYELRLYRGNGSWGKLLDVLRVEIVAERVPRALAISKRVFRPEEPIEVTVDLPRNRYYHGAETGPNVVVYPLDVSGRRIPTDEAFQWLSSTWGCATTCASLKGQVWIPGSEGQNPHNQYHLAVRPGRYVIRPGLKEQGIDQEPLFAPKEPGHYEIRLYDRGFGYPAQDYVDLYLASQEIVVEPFGTVAKVAEVKFVRKTDQGVETIPDKILRGGGLVAVEAEMDADTPPEDKQRSGKLRLGEGPNAEERQLDFYRESARIFRSQWFRIEVAPSAAEALPSEIPSTEPPEVEVSP